VPLWATVASLLATAKLNGVEPFAYLKDVLERLSNGHPKPPTKPP
jgi:transposase